MSNSAGMLASSKSLNVLKDIIPRKRENVGLAAGTRISRSDGRLEES